MIVEVSFLVWSVALQLPAWVVFGGIVISAVTYKMTHKS